MTAFDTSRLVIGGLRVAGRMPGWSVRVVCHLAADVAWALHGGGVRQLEANLRRVRPDAGPRELRRLSLAGMRSYMRYYGETFTLGALSRTQISARVREVGLDGVRPSLDAGQTVVLALGHLGNWDLAGAWATPYVGHVTTVAERLEPEELFEEFLRFREQLGMTVIPLPKGGSDVFRQLVRVVRGSGPAGFVPLLGDRDLTARGVEVQLFGQTARVAAGPASLAIATGAPLVPVVVRYERIRGPRRRAAGSPWGIVVTFCDPVLVDPEGLTRHEHVHALTQGWVDELERGIDAAPQDWHMLQKVFVADLDAARYADTLAAQDGTA